MSKVYDKESQDLETHVSICAERYQGIADKFESISERFQAVDARFSSLETKMDAIQADIIEGQRSMKTTLIGSAATILGGIMSLALVIYIN